MKDLVTVASVTQALERAALTDHGITLVDRNLDQRRIPYADLADAAARAAAGLRAAGTAPGDRVCLLGPTGAELLGALFGTWVAGGVPVVLPLPRRQSELPAFVEDIVGRIDRTGAAVLGASELLLEMAPPFQTTAQVLTLESLAQTDGRAEAAQPGPGDLAYLQFTSGTTARSRAVCLTHGQLLANLDAAGRMAEVDADRDVFVSWLPLFHDMGLIGMLLGSVVFRTDLVLIPTEEFLGRPGCWTDAMSRYRGTITASPNFGYGLAARDLTNKPRALDLSAWRIAANGAEAVDLKTVTTFAAAAAPYGFDDRAMCPMFGLAEATLAVSLSAAGEPVHQVWVDREALEGSARVERVAPDTPGARAFVACGHAIPGHDLAIMDDQDRVLPPGHVGEICFRGPSVMAGYWRNDEATAEAIRDGWLHTGDLGFMCEHGLVVCGRKKDMIILGGRNLYPEDYEFHAEQVPGVRRGNVIAFAIPERERMVVVAETTADPAEVDGIARATLEALRRELPRGPEEVVLIPAGTLPKTSSGKRQRGTCRERYTSGDLAPLAVARR